MGCSSLTVNFLRESSAQFINCMTCTIETFLFPVILINLGVLKSLAITSNQWWRHCGPSGLSMLSMWKLSVKFRVIVKPSCTEMTYWQDTAWGGWLGYPGLNRCPSGSSNIPPPQDTGHEREERNWETTNPDSPSSPLFYSATGNLEILYVWMRLWSGAKFSQQTPVWWSERTFIGSIFVVLTHTGALIRAKFIAMMTGAEIWAKSVEADLRAEWPWAISRLWCRTFIYV